MKHSNHDATIGGVIENLYERLNVLRKNHGQKDLGDLSRIEELLFNKEPLTQKELLEVLEENRPPNLSKDNISWGAFCGVAKWELSKWIEKDARPKSSRSLSLEANQRDAHTPARQTQSHSDPIAPSSSLLNSQYSPLAPLQLQFEMESP